MHVSKPKTCYNSLHNKELEGGYMVIRIEKLRPEHASQYIEFFDGTKHDDGIDDHKCYCCCWASDSSDGKDFSRVENRREYAREYVINEKIQGYLAYYDKQIVGWCNTNNKADCLQCESWRRFMQYVPLDDLEAQKKVKSIFCFVIAPEMKRKGIATKLLEQICLDAKNEGYDVVEAYPYVEEAEETAFTGYVAMYQKYGFEIVLNETGRLIMRKELR